MADSFLDFKEVFDPKDYVGIDFSDFRQTWKWQEQIARPLLESAGCGNIYFDNGELDHGDYIPCHFSQIHVQDYRDNYLIIYFGKEDFKFANDTESLEMMTERLSSILEKLITISG